MHWKYKKALQIIAKLVADNKRTVFSANELKAALNEEMGNPQENSIMLRDFLALGRLSVEHFSHKSKKITAYNVQIPNFPAEIKIKGATK